MTKVSQPVKLTPEEREEQIQLLLPERKDVPVYKDTFDLLVFVYRTAVGMSRDHRFTLAEDMKRTLSELLTNIYGAKKSSDPLAHLERALHYSYHAKVLFRVMSELRLLKGWHESYYIIKLSSVSKQLSAWYRYEKRKTKQDAHSTGNI